VQRKGKKTAAEDEVEVWRTETFAREEVSNGVN